MYYEIKINIFKALKYGLARKEFLPIKINYLFLGRKKCW